MLIILEGTDCAGKSTLARQLGDHIAEYWEQDRIEIKHAGPPTTHPYGEYIEPLTDFDPMSHETIICDRWHVGEAVYPKILGRETQMTSAMFHYVNHFIKRRGGLMVNVKADPLTITERFNKRGDDRVTLYQALRARDEFNQILSALGPVAGCRASVDHYDSDKDKISRIMDAAWRANMNGLIYPLSYIGHTFCHQLIVMSEHTITAYPDLVYLVNAMHLMFSSFGTILDVDMATSPSINQAYVALGCPEIVLMEDAELNCDGLRESLPFASVREKRLPTPRNAIDSGLPYEVYTRMIRGETP